MKHKYKLALIDMAERFGQTSTAERLKVGALIYKNDSIIALGVNGMPPKWPTEVCEDRIDMTGAYAWAKEWRQEEEYPYFDGKIRYKLITKPECRHAEIAALEKLWNSSETANGATMFVSHSPCKMCAIKIMTAGIVEVIYRHDYRSDEGIKYLIENGVEVNRLVSEEYDALQPF